MPIKKPFKRLWAFFALGSLSLLSVEAVYFHRIIHSPSPAGPVDMVVVYSGAEGRMEAGLTLARNLGCGSFLFSGWNGSDSRREVRRIGGAGDMKVLWEDRARTTDQNARYSTPLIRSSGAKTLALVVPWYHLPRALFLTRLYLSGSGIKVIPALSGPLPADGIGRKVLFGEFLKFWGSLGRVFLSLLGVENWPPPRGLSPAPASS